MVPEAKINAVGVRRLSTQADLGRVFSFLKSTQPDPSNDWKFRAKNNAERMAKGGILGVAQVVKELHALSEFRPLPDKERELYNDSRHQLVSELAASLGILECDAEDSIDLLLVPPGKDRIKRSPEELRAGELEGDADGVDLEADLLGLGDAPEVAAEEEPEPDADEDGESDDAAPAKAAKGKKVAPKKAPTRKPELSDDEATEAAGQPFLVEQLAAALKGVKPKPRKGAPAKAAAKPAAKKAAPKPKAAAKPAAAKKKKK